MFNNNDLDRAIQLSEYIFFLICSIVAIGLGITCKFDNMVTNMLFMGFGWSLSLGSIYMIYRHFKK